MTAYLSESGVRAFELGSTSCLSLFAALFAAFFSLRGWSSAGEILRRFLALCSSTWGARDGDGGGAGKESKVGGKESKEGATSSILCWSCWPL